MRDFQFGPYKMMVGQLGAIHPASLVFDTSHHFRQSLKSPREFSSTMTPCDRAPVEIWQNIFLILAQTESIPEFDELECQFWGRKPQLSSTRGPLILPRTPSLLSQVCSQWRECAQGMPDLWNVLSVKSPRYASQYNSSQYTGIAKLVKRRLSLSRFMPLKICVDAKDDIEFARLIIPALLPFSQLWETMHLYAPPLAFANLDSLHASNIPHLVSLKTVSQMFVPGATVSPSELTCIPLTDRISTIRRLCTSFLPSSTSPVYGALEELHIQQIRSETRLILLVLASCPRLKVLTLSGFGLTMPLTNSPAASQPALIMPELEALNLEHPVGREAQLDSLVLPHLQSLFLCGKSSGESGQSVLNCINRLKERSDVSSLERLSISLEMHSMDHSILIAFLRANPSLKYLWIDDTYRFMNQPFITSYFFDALTKRFSESNPIGEALLCPQLESLKLTGCSEFEDAKLLTFLKSRCPLECYKANIRSKDAPTATLTRVHISVKRKMEAELLETVHQWEEMGYLINLDSRS